jgi:hypothetical protein
VRIKLVSREILLFPSVNFLLIGIATPANGLYLSQMIWITHFELSIVLSKTLDIYDIMT